MINKYLTNGLYVCSFSATQGNAYCLLRRILLKATIRRQEQQGFLINPPSNIAVAFSKNSFIEIWVCR